MNLLITVVEKWILHGVSEIFCEIAMTLAGLVTITSNKIGNRSEISRSLKRNVDGFGK